MSQYPPQEPQRQQEYNPYQYNNPYSQQPPQTNTPPPGQGYYLPQQAQNPYNPYANPGQKSDKPLKIENTATQLWNGLVRFLGKRGLIIAAGSLLATLAFLLFPYYSLYTGYFLAAETLDDKWWLELILPLVALAVVIVRQVVPRLKEQNRASSLFIMGSGILGMLVHYWFLGGEVSTNYWRFGSWIYLLGMAMVAIGGLLSLLVSNTRRATA